MNAQRLEIDIRTVAFLLVAAFAASAWIAWAEQPTARNMRRAIRETLPLL